MKFAVLNKQIGATHPTESPGQASRNIQNDAALRFRFRATARHIIKRTSPTEEYTLWGRYINTHLDEFLADIGDWFRELFLQMYNQVLNENLQQPAAVEV